MINYIKQLVLKIINEDFYGMAAEMAFWFILGLFPFLLFLTSIFAWLGKKSLMFPIIEFLTNVAPPDVARLIETVLNEAMIFRQGTLIAVIGFFITVALASNAIAVIIKGLNRALELKETRSFVYTRSLSVLMVFVNAFILFLAINSIVLGKVIVGFLITYTPISFSSIQLINMLRWPISLIVLFVMAYINYYILPNLNDSEKMRRKSSIWGTLFFCICWLIGSWGFSVYLNNLNAYNKVYGTIGAFAILMVWLYYTSLMMLVGGEINSKVYARLKRQQNK